MDERIIGDEDQVELMDEINSNMEDDGMEFAERVKKLETDIELYQGAIKDAQDALAEAERELEEEFANNADLPY